MNVAANLVQRKRQWVTIVLCDRISGGFQVWESVRAGVRRTPLQRAGELGSRGRHSCLPHRELCAGGRRWYSMGLPAGGE